MKEIQPKLERRLAHDYVAIAATVPMRKIPELLPPLIPEVLNWVAEKGNHQAGPVFFRYLKMAGDHIEVEVGVPTKTRLTGDQRVKPGQMPAGLYAVVTYMGHYSNLPQVHAAIEQWGNERGLKITGTRVEYYPTDPAEVPDTEKWQTDVTVQVVE